jgi:hypothetical protein
MLYFYETGGRFGADSTCVFQRCTHLLISRYQQQSVSQSSWCINLRESLVVTQSTGSWTVQRARTRRDLDGCRVAQTSRHTLREETVMKMTADAKLVY